MTPSLASAADPLHVGASPRRGGRGRRATAVVLAVLVAIAAGGATIGAGVPLAAAEDRIDLAPPIGVRADVPPPPSDRDSTTTSTASRTDPSRTGATPSESPAPSVAGPTDERGSPGLAIGAAAVGLVAVAAVAVVAVTRRNRSDA